MINDSLLYGVPREVVGNLAELDNPSRPLQVLSSVEIADLIRKACVGIAIALEVRNMRDLKGSELPYDLEQAKRLLIRSGDAKSIHVLNIGNNDSSHEQHIHHLHP